MRKLGGLRILVTGASSGIGRSLARQALERGARVAVTARSGEKLQELLCSVPDHAAEAVAVPADVTRAEDRRRLLEAVAARFGGLDVLINNAGVGSFGHFAESSEAVLRQVLEVNFFAAAELIRESVPLLRRGERPAILNVASMCGRRGLPAWPEYSASKFALCGLTEALRAEMVRFGIDVLLVLPGLTRTGLGQNLLRNEGRMRIDFTDGMDPDAVAARILLALERNKAETVLGREARWMLLLNRLFPRILDRLLARKVHQLYAGSGA